MSFGQRHISGVKQQLTNQFLELVIEVLFTKPSASYFEAVEQVSDMSLLQRHAGVSMGMCSSIVAA